MTRKVLMALAIAITGIVAYFAFGFFTPDASPPLLGNAVRSSEQSVEIMPEAIILEAPVVMEQAPDSGGSNDYDTVTVSFATNRKFDPAAPFDDQFGTERGVLEQQNWFASFIFEPDPEKHVLVQEFTVLDRAAVLSLVAEQAGEDDGDVLVLSQTLSGVGMRSFAGYSYPASYCQIWCLRIECHAAL